MENSWKVGKYCNFTTFGFIFESLESFLNVMRDTITKKI